MSLPALQEMIELHEAGSKLVDAFKKGYNDTKDKYEKAQSKLDKSAEDKAKAAEKEDKDTTTKKTAVDKQAIADQVAMWVEEFFSKFPNYGGSGGAEDIILQYPSRETREVAVKAFTTLAERVEQLRNAFNKSLVAAGKLQPAQVKRFDQTAKMMMGANAPAPPQALIRFVKNEANFFKRLVRIKDNLELNDSDFKTLLQLKIKQTAAERVPDAAQALNMLFGYMNSEFLAHSRQIAEANVAADDEGRKERLANT